MIARLPWVTSILCVGCVSVPPSGSDDTTGTTTTGGSTGTSDESSTGMLEADSTATTEGSSSSSTTTTGGPGPCTSDADCTDAATPFCSPVLQECVDCNGMPDPHAACAGLDPGLPACGEGGVCVQCTETVTDACQDTTPLCDTESNQCVACTAHDQCGDAACNLFTGACLPQDAVLSVGPGQEYLTLAAAVATVPAGGQATIIVYEGVYDEPVMVVGNRVVAFLASPGAEPEWLRTIGSAASQLAISSGATALIDGLTFRLNASPAVPLIDVAGGSLWMDRGRVVQAPGGAMQLDNADVVVRSSFLDAGVNRIVLDAQGSQVNVSYSTLVGSFGASIALACDAASTVTMRDSIVLSNSADPEVVCDVDAEHTASEVLLTGTGNQEVGDFMSAWFVDDGNGDYHLSPASGEATFADIAEWNEGDPLFDIDGQPRSGVDGTPEHAGGDRP